MHEGGVTLFLVGVAVIGLAPVALAVVYLARRRADARRGDVEEGGATPSSGLRAVSIAIGVVVALALLIAWSLSSFGTAPPSPTGMTSMGGMDGSSLGSNVAGASSLPGSLAGMAMTGDVTGPEAVQQVAQLHGDQFPITGAEIAEYADGKVTVWVSWSADAATSAAMVERMTARIAEGGSPFDPPKPLRSVEGVWVTHGMGQVHFFFARGTSVYWLAADRQVARRALARVLEVAA